MAQLVKLGLAKPEQAKPKAELPPAGAHLWPVFLDLDQARDYDFNGNPKAIPYAEINQRGHALGFPLDPWEVTAIRRLDALRRRLAMDSGGSEDGGTT